MALELLEPDGRHLLDDLDRAEVDFLIIPAQYAAPEHAQEVLYEDSYACVAWEGNARLANGLSADQYSALTHALSHIHWTEFSGAQSSLVSLAVPPGNSATLFLSLTTP